MAGGYSAVPGGEVQVDGDRLPHHAHEGEVTPVLLRLIQQLRLGQHAPGGVYAQRPRRAHIDRESLAAAKDHGQGAGILALQDLLQIQSDAPPQPFQIGIGVQADQQPRLHLAGSRRRKTRQTAIDQPLRQLVHLTGGQEQRQCQKYGVDIGRQRRQSVVHASHRDCHRLHPDFGCPSIVVCGQPGNGLRHVAIDQ